jgi:predicted ATPase
MKRYILTGTPGAGKTSILRELAAYGFDVVDEAATAVIAARQAQGDPEPWTRTAFVDQVVAAQRDRQTRRAAADTGVAVADTGVAAVGTGVEVYDRSPVCTHALSTYLGRPVSRALSAEIDRITGEGIYERQVFFVRNIGFCEPTGARRISFAESLVFERMHEESYRAFGYELVEVPAGEVADRAALVRNAISRLAGLVPPGGSAL